MRTDNRCLVCGTEVVDGQCSPDCIMSEDAPNISSDMNADIVLDEEESRVLVELLLHPPGPTLAMRELMRRYGKRGG